MVSHYTSEKYPGITITNEDILQIKHEEENLKRIVTFNTFVRGITFEDLVHIEKAYDFISTDGCNHYIHPPTSRIFKYHEPVITSSMKRRWQEITDAAEKEGYYEIIKEVERERERKKEDT